MRVAPEVLAAIEAHARREAPKECCGLLIGDSDRVVEAVPCANLAEDPVRRYRIAPEDLFAQIRRCRERPAALRIVGGYHSHPRSVAQPSPTDHEEAFAGFLCVIAGPVDGSRPYQVRAFELLDGNLQEVGFVPDPEGADP